MTFGVDDMYDAFVGFRIAKLSVSVYVDLDC